MAERSDDTAFARALIIEITVNLSPLESGVAAIAFPPQSIFLFAASTLSGGFSHTHRLRPENEPFSPK